MEEINIDDIIKILMKILHIIMLYSIIISEKGVDIMSMALMDCIEKLVPISDFSQGKAGKIFSDVAENNSEYIVLKNNQPTAVLVSVKEYKETQNKLAKLERLLEMVENFRLLKLAESRIGDNTTPFEDLVAEEGYSMEELEELAESVEFG